MVLPVGPGPPGAKERPPPGAEDTGALPTQRSHQVDTDLTCTLGKLSTGTETCGAGFLVLLQHPWGVWAIEIKTDRAVTLEGRGGVGPTCRGWAGHWPCSSTSPISKGTPYPALSRRGTRGGPACHFRYSPDRWPVFPKWFPLPLRTSELVISSPHVSEHLLCARE